MRGVFGLGLIRFQWVIHATYERDAERVKWLVEEGMNILVTGHSSGFCGPDSSPESEVGTPS